MLMGSPQLSFQQFAIARYQNSRQNGGNNMKLRLIGLAATVVALFQVAGANFKW
jgi:hypothetical protein